MHQKYSRIIIHSTDFPLIYDIIYRMTDFSRLPNCMVHTKTRYILRYLSGLASGMHLKSLKCLYIQEMHIIICYQRILYQQDNIGCQIIHLYINYAYFHLTATSFLSFKKKFKVHLGFTAAKMPLNLRAHPTIRS